MRIIIDANSVLNAALLGGKDPDGRTVLDEAGERHQVNSAQWGVDKFFDKISELCEKFDAAPRQMVSVLDGRNAKVRRQAFLPQYKVGRDKAPEVSEQLNLAREKVSQMMLALGACTAVQTGFEGDDVIGYLCRTLRNERNVVVTSDGDLNVLVDDNTDVWRLGEMNKNPYGPFPHRFITLYKSLVGDTSDKIPGAKGFGDAAWCDLIRIFGLENLPEFERMIVEGKLDELKESVPDLKVLQKVIDAKDMVTTSWRVASLHIDEINTMRRPLEIQAGMVQQWVGGDDQVPALRRFYGTKLLVDANNFQAVYERLSKTRFTGSPFVALDIETSASDESEEWSQAKAIASEGKKKARFDVLGHELTSMALTFGQNTQHTIFMTVDHADSNNITVDQCREMCELIPQNLHTVIQNRNFEFSVLYRTWGQKWKDNGWHGFIPNAIDTKVGASYVDENVESVDGDGEIHTTQGKVLDIETKEPWEDRQYRMNELTAKEVLDYGCDDTICTAALHTHYKFVMDIEHTWDTYTSVEQRPEYLTTLAFVQGVPLAMSVINDMSKRDDATYEKCWDLLRTYLISKGWEGVVCPEFEGDIEASDVKLVAGILGMEEFATKKRKLNAIASDIRTQFPDKETFATIVERNDVDALNDLVKANFTGEPQINFGSPKQMQNLFYRVVGITPRLVNKMTDAQRANDPVMADAFRKRAKAKKAGETATYTPEELEKLISKSSTDDTAVDTALAMDTDLSEESKSVLTAFKSLKEVMTRRGLYYTPYRLLPHWRDGKIHPSLNQAEAVTRRYSASDPNVQQQPAHGDGVELRKSIPALNKDHIVVSLDFKGQELVIQAELSGDEALTSCFVGDNKRDVHTLTAVSAAILVFKEDITYDQYAAQLKSEDPAVKAAAEQKRKDAKTTNFAAAYGAMADTVAIGLKSTPEVGQQFLDARSAAFPGLAIWVDKEIERLKTRGFTETMMGARRHLREAMTSENHWDRAGAERQGVNHIVQGSAGEQTKMAMGRMWDAGIFTGKYRAQFYFPVHDEVVYSVHRDDAFESICETHALMVQPYSTMSMPVVSTIAIGSSFLCEIEIGPVPDRKLIEAAIDKLFKPEAATV